jgi:broad specificity phosphatase PhoE
MINRQQTSNDHLSEWAESGIRVYLIDPGATCYDEQGRVAGNLDLPLCGKGIEQVSRLKSEMANVSISALYHSPNMAAELTAVALESTLKLRAKCSADLKNLDFGLWQGLLWEDIRERYPKAWRGWVESPSEYCPPQGEPLESAEKRLRAFVDDLLRRYQRDSVCVVAPFPLSAILSGLMQGREKPMLTTLREGGTIEVIDLGHGTTRRE